MSLRTSLRPLASALRPLCAPSPARALPFLANSVSTPRYTSSTSTSSHLPTGTTRDPAHPHLYYHLLPTPAAPESIALSFLPSYPLPSSSTIIGSLPAKAGAGLHDFRENPGFREVLSAAIKDGLEKKVDGGLEYEAEMRPGDGYMTLTDERAVPPQGRIGETEDLIGSVFVENGKIVASTYEAFPSYRLVTPNGVCTLSPGLDAHVVAYLEKVDAEEREKEGAGQ